MASQPFPVSSRSVTGRSFPFRTASAGVGRTYLLDKLNSRPKVAAAPFAMLARDARDAQDDRLSGMTRSLQHRVRGLNLPVVPQSGN